MSTSSAIEQTANQQTDKQSGKLSREIQRVLKGELVVNPGTFLDGEVSQELALKIRARLNAWIKPREQEFQKSVPDIAKGLKNNEFIVDNSYAIAVSRFQKANNFRSPSGSVDAPTYRALFPEEFPQKLPTTPAGQLTSKGFSRIAGTQFYRNGSVYAELENNNVRFYRNFPTTERSPASQVAQIAVVTEGEKLRADRIATVSRGMSEDATHAIVSYSADGWGGVGSLRSKVDFPSGPMNQQLYHAGFSEREPGVFERTLLDTKGRTVPVVAIASASTLQALLLPLEGIDTNIAVSDIGVAKQNNRRETVLPVQTSGGEKRIAVSGNRARVEN